VLYSKLRNGSQFKKYRKKHPGADCKFLCVLFKRNEEEHARKLAKLVDALTIYEEYVEQYYPANSRRENLRLLTAAQEAGGELLDNCVICPTRCISEMNRKCVSFDEFV
jgi:uncharacterized Fe-S radical SAM superfamily protein PflX